jgi:hypothetical protein
MSVLVYIESHNGQFKKSIMKRWGLRASSLSAVTKLMRGRTL